MKLHLFPILLLWIVSTASTPADETADATFARAAELADTDLTKSRELYRVAALKYQAEALTGPSHRGPLLYNSGNAFFLAGDPGQAVVAYRRAEQAMPGSRLLQDNLAYVRMQCGNVAEDTAATPFGRLRFWKWNPALLWTLLAVSTAAFWLAMLITQWRGTRIPRPLTHSLLACSAILAATLTIQHFKQITRCRGVVVTPRTEARKGPNYGYKPAFTAPLDAGLECDVVGRQGDWLHLRITPERECWVRDTAVEIWQGSTPES